MRVPHDPLTQPVGALMRACDTVRPDDSLRLVAEFLREAPGGLLPITDGPYLAGAVTESSILKALASGLSQDDSANGATIADPVVISPHASGAEALRLFSHTGGLPLIVIDETNRVLGILAPSDLYPKRPSPIRPAMIGGMATPFGVYLTTGNVRAGASDLALVLTGACLFLLAAGGAIAAELLTPHLRLGALSPHFRDTATILLFLIGMRLIPLSGIHAAEHKVVHAIERGEELNPTIVKRMPRVHPRCGTNIAVGASLFLGIGSATFLPYRELQLILALLVTLAFWRPLGALVQSAVTTRPPSDKHIDSGIAAGRELLARYARAGARRPTILQRIWFTGLPHVMTGSMIAYTIVEFALARLGLHVAV